MTTRDTSMQDDAVDQNHDFSCPDGMGWGETMFVRLMRRGGEPYAVEVAVGETPESAFEGCSSVQVSLEALARLGSWLRETLADEGTGTERR